MVKEKISKKQISQTGVIEQENKAIEINEIKTEKDKNTKRDIKPEKPKKIGVYVNARDIPISTKESKAICKFIKNKKIDSAISDLEKVLIHKKAVPMKGEIPHRKGKGIMSGRYPEKAVKNFIILLKSLSANATNQEIGEPIIFEAIANIGNRPYGKFGRVRKKRTHIKIGAKSIIKLKRKKN